MHSQGEDHIEEGGEQIMQRWGDNRGGYRGGGNTFNRGEN